MFLLCGSVAYWYMYKGARPARSTEQGARPEAWVWKVEHWVQNTSHRSTMFKTSNQIIPIIKLTFILVSKSLATHIRNRILSYSLQ